MSTAVDEQAASAEPGGAAGAPRQGPGRISSLDAARGAMLVVSVVSSNLLTPPAWFEHAQWGGVHPLDLVFPAFVTLSGCGLALAHRRGVRVRRLVRRVVVLLVAGLLYGAAMDWLRAGRVDLHALRWTGVLQLYAVVVLVVALGHLLTRTWRGWTAVALALAAVHTGLLVAWQQRCPGGVLTPRCNPSRSLDAAVLPARHLYWAMGLGHDPEGLVGILGACASAAAGAAAAHALTGVREGARRSAARSRVPVAPVLGLVAVLAGAALAAATLVPPMKRLWTAPFGLGVAAGVVVLLLALTLVLDARRPGAALRAARWPLVALGRNSLLVYFGSHVVTAALVHLPHRPPALATRIGDGLPLLGSPQLGLSAVVLAVWAALAAVLHRYRLYGRA